MTEGIRQPPSPRRRVWVDVATRRSGARVSRQAPVVVVGLVGPDAPWLCERAPGAAVRSTRFGSRHGAVELLAWGPGVDLSLLPGLDPRRPSRVRDAVALALAAGAPEVLTLLVRGESLGSPWDLNRSNFLDLSGPFLEDLPGATLVLPDAGGPAPLAPLPELEPERRVHQLCAAITALAPTLGDRYQAALVDWPLSGLEPDGLDPSLIELPGADVALCAWSGPPAALARHGWRSAAAAVAGALGDQEPYIGSLGRVIQLGSGRRSGSSPPLRPSLPRGASTVLELHPTRDEATILDDATLRRPQGDWSLPALRTLKAIHRAVVNAAERFVFSRLELSTAFTLALAINQAVGPFVSAGLLVGLDGEGGPEVDGDLERDPAAPSLVATLAGQVRPWCREVRIRVRVSDGAAPRLEGEQT